MTATTKAKTQTAAQRKRDAIKAEAAELSKAAAALCAPYVGEGNTATVVPLLGGDKEAVGCVIRVCKAEHAHLRHTDLDRWLMCIRRDFELCRYTRGHTWRYFVELDYLDATDGRGGTGGWVWDMTEVRRFVARTGARENWKAVGSFLLQLHYKTLEEALAGMEEGLRLYASRQLLRQRFEHELV